MPNDFDRKIDDELKSVEELCAVFAGIDSDVPHYTHAERIRTKISILRQIIQKETELMLWMQDAMMLLPYTDLKNVVQAYGTLCHLIGFSKGSLEALELVPLE